LIIRGRTEGCRTVKRWYPGVYTPPCYPGVYTPPCYPGVYRTPCIHGGYVPPCIHGGYTPFLLPWRVYTVPAPMVGMYACHHGGYVRLSPWWVCTPVTMVGMYLPVYVAYHGGYVPPCVCSLPTMVGIHHPSLYASSLLPGIPTIPPSDLLSARQRTTDDGAR